MLFLKNNILKNMMKIGKNKMKKVIKMIKN